MARISLNSKQHTKTKQVNALQKVIDKRDIKLTIKPITQVTTEETISGYSIRYRGNVAIAQKYKGYALTKFGIAHKRNSNRNAWQNNMSDLALEDKISLRMYRVGHLAVIEITAGDEQLETDILGLMAQWAIYDENNKSEMEWLIPLYINNPEAKKLNDDVVIDTVVKSVNNIFVKYGVSMTEFTKYPIRDKKTPYISELSIKSQASGNELMTTAYTPSKFRGNLTQLEGKPEIEISMSFLSYPNQIVPIPHLMAFGYAGQLLGSGQYSKMYLHDGELYALKLFHQNDSLIKFKMIDPEGYDKTGIPFGGSWERQDSAVGGIDGNPWNFMDTEEAYPEEFYTIAVYGTVENPTPAYPRPGNISLFASAFTPEVVVNQSGTECAFIIKYEFTRYDRDHSYISGGLWGILLSRRVVINLKTMRRAKKDNVGHCGHGSQSNSDLPVLQVPGVNTVTNQGRAVVNISLRSDDGDGTYWSDGTYYQYHCYPNQTSVTTGWDNINALREETITTEDKWDKSYSYTKDDVGSVLKVEYDNDKLLELCVEYKVKIDWLKKVVLQYDSNIGPDANGELVNECQVACEWPGEGVIQTDKRTTTLDITNTYEENFTLNGSLIASNSYIETTKDYKYEEKVSTDNDFVTKQETNAPELKRDYNDIEAISLKHGLYLQVKNELSQVVTL